MSPQYIRYGFICFFVLSTGFIANLLFLQPNSWQSETKKEARAAAARVKPVTLSAVAKSQAPPVGTVGDGTAQSPRVLNVTATEAAAETSIAFDETAVGQHSAPRELVRAVQRELKVRGYWPGAEDGISGSVTRAAVMAYQVDQGLEVTSEINEGLLQHIVLGTAPDLSAQSQRPTAQTVAAMREVVANVQSGLAGLGYFRGPIDGQLSAKLTDAIRRFETQQQWRPTGRISGRLLTHLPKPNGTGALANRW